MNRVRQNSMKALWIKMIVVGMTLGTAWAVRGQFGHEQGAAWAGAIGALGLVLVAKRADWWKRISQVALAAAVGWGAGGIISYGRVVGYGRSDDLFNAFYGLLMLFVIGGLFGLLGGGLTGLALESSKEKKVNWAALLVEMVVGGLLFYGFLIMQLGIAMTPPRSEAWAFILGAGLAMVWHMARKGFSSSLRVAVYAMLGAGFGFASGNFLQILGNVLNIPFNMWNVMEYNIGFWGGIGLAYGVLSSAWPDVSDEQPKKWEITSALLLILVFVPAVIFKESLTVSKLAKNFDSYSVSKSIAVLSSLLALAGMLLVAFINFFNYRRNKSVAGQREAFLLFVSYFALYIFISFVATGLFAGKIHSNHVLYLVNIVLILFLIRFYRNRAESDHSEIESMNILRVWPYCLVALILIIFLLSFISVSIHGELSGAHNRFTI
ncbi:hypothetical protein D1614_10420 [Maribellus luteus]|uniref:Uncharacterized protein n=1 Tax=Maribellus luteus TaxID=2305463 RepID=A0A399SZB9_9BACT|nr:hypothetical protein [Maribellus luteus]RIJ48144.1 hypothetical protein D1614_10420 [Maribellus luteus]